MSYLESLLLLELAQDQNSASNSVTYRNFEMYSDAAIDVLCVCVCVH
jgi:hypothetical protein